MVTYCPPFLFFLFPSSCHQGTAWTITTHVFPRAYTFQSFQQRLNQQQHQGKTLAMNSWRRCSKNKKWHTVTAPGAASRCAEGTCWFAGNNSGFSTRKQQNEMFVQAKPFPFGSLFRYGAPHPQHLSPSVNQMLCPKSFRGKQTSPNCSLLAPGRRVIKATKSIVMLFRIIQSQAPGVFALEVSCLQ